MLDHHPTPVVKSGPSHISHTPTPKPEQEQIAWRANANKLHSFLYGTSSESGSPPEVHKTIPLSGTTLSGGPASTHAHDVEPPEQAGGAVAHCTASGQASSPPAGACPESAASALCPFSVPPEQRTLLRLRRRAPQAAAEMEQKPVTVLQQSKPSQPCPGLATPAPALRTGVPKALPLGPGRHRRFLNLDTSEQGRPAATLGNHKKLMRWSSDSSSGEVSAQTISDTTPSASDSSSPTFRSQKLKRCVSTSDLEAENVASGTTSWDEMSNVGEVASRMKVHGSLLKRRRTEEGNCRKNRFFQNRSPDTKKALTSSKR